MTAATTAPKLQPNQIIDKKMPPASTPVAAGSTAVFPVPAIWRFHMFSLSLTDLTVAQINEIRLIVNSKVINRYSGTQRDAINQFYGLPAENDEEL